MGECFQVLTIHNKRQSSENDDVKNDTCYHIVLKGIVQQDCRQCVYQSWTPCINGSWCDQTIITVTMRGAVTSNLLCPVECSLNSRHYHLYLSSQISFPCWNLLAVYWTAASVMPALHQDVDSRLPGNWPRHETRQLFEQCGKNVESSGCFHSLFLTMNLLRITKPYRSRLE